MYLAEPPGDHSDLEYLGTTDASARPSDWADAITEVVKGAASVFQPGPSPLLATNADGTLSTVAQHPAATGPNVATSDSLRTFGLVAVIALGAVAVLMMSRSRR